MAEAFEIAEQSRARSLRDMMHDTTREAAENWQVAARLQRTLPAGTTLISYYTFPPGRYRRFYAWKITRSQLEGMMVPVGQDVLQPMIDTLYNVLRLRPTASRTGSDVVVNTVAAISRPLLEYLIKPLNIPLQAKLIVIPHRFLHFLPFAALRDKAWLIQDHQLLFAPSAAVWLQAQSRARGRTNVLAFGNPATAGAPVT